MISGGAAADLPVGLAAAVAAAGVSLLLLPAEVSRLWFSALAALLLQKFLGQSAVSGTGAAWRRYIRGCGAIAGQWPKFPTLSRVRRFEHRAVIARDNDIDYLPGRNAWGFHARKILGVPGAAAFG
jgi:hypothetical protein